MDRKEKRLGEILIEKGLLKPEELERALKQQRRTKEFLGSILVKKGIISAKNLSKVLSQQFDIPFVNIEYKDIDWEFVKKFSSSLILDYKCFPIEKDEYSVTVAITNPLDAWALKKAEEETRHSRLKLVLVSEENMKEARRRYQEYMRGEDL